MAVKTFFLIKLPIHEEQTNTNKSTTKIMKLFATCLEKNSTVYSFKMFSKHQVFAHKKQIHEIRSFKKTNTVEMFCFHIYQSNVSAQ